jgi:hypothetical protein
MERFIQATVCRAQFSRAGRVVVLGVHRSRIAIDLILRTNNAHQIKRPFGSQPYARLSVQDILKKIVRSDADNSNSVCHRS